MLFASFSFPLSWHPQHVGVHRHRVRGRSPGPISPGKRTEVWNIIASYLTLFALFTALDTVGDHAGLPSLARCPVRQNLRLKTCT